MLRAVTTIVDLSETGIIFRARDESLMSETPMLYYEMTAVITTT
jgi:hypothetical protein